MFSQQKGGLLPETPRKVSSLIRMFESGVVTPDTHASTITDKPDVQSDTRNVSIQESHTQEPGTSDSIIEHSDSQQSNVTDQSSADLDHEEPNKQETTGQGSVIQEAAVTTTGCTHHEPSTEQGSTEICTPNPQGAQKWNIELANTNNCCSRDSFTKEVPGSSDYGNQEGDTPEISTSAPSTPEGASTEAKPRKVLDLRQLKQGLKEAKPERELKRELWTIIEECENEDDDDPVPLKSRRTLLRRAARLSIYPPEVGQDGDIVRDPDTTGEDDASAKRPVECLPGYPAEQEMNRPVIIGNADAKPETVHAPTDNGDHDSNQSRGHYPTDRADSAPVIHTSSGAIYRMLSLSPLEQREPPVKADIIQFDVDSFKRSRSNGRDLDGMDQIYDDIEMDQRSDVCCEDSIYDHIE